MNAPLLRLALLSAVAVRLSAAEPAPAPPAAEHPPAESAPAAAPASGPSPAPATSPSTAADNKTPAAPAPAASAPNDSAKQPTPAAPTAPASDSATAPTKPAPETPTVLPQVEVKKDRITPLDVELQKQDQAIAREKKNTKPTPVDEALNNSKLSKALAIFGGSSAERRAGVAQERVELMQEERDLIQEIEQAPTKEEKQELQQLLDDIRATRRELERGPSK